MSKRGWCAYCHLQNALEKAARDGQAVTIQLSVDDCGYDVYIHPPDVKMPEHIRCRGPLGLPDPDLPEIKYWVTWLFNDYEQRGCFCND